MVTADGSAGLGRRPLSGANHQIEAFLWDGDERVSDGDTVDLWVAVDPVTYSGAGAGVLACRARRAGRSGPSCRKAKPAR